MNSFPKRKTGIRMPEKVESEDERKSKFLAGFISHSSAIAGIESDYKLLKSQVRVQKKDGHVGALLYLEEIAKDKQHMLTSDDLKKIHRLISEEQSEKELAAPFLSLNSIGEYRMEVNFFSKDKAFPDYSDVYRLVSQYLMEFRVFQSKIEGFSEAEKVRVCADLHFDFMAICPFANNNGQVGRAIVFYLLTFAGIKPFIFFYYDYYAVYYSALKNTNREMIRNYFYQKAAIKL